MQAREVLLAAVQARFATLAKAELIGRLEKAGLPFAPIMRPEDLFEDPHLAAGGGLAPTVLPDGCATRLPILPIEMAGRRTGRDGALPAAGEHTLEILAQLGVSEEETAMLRAERVI